MGNDRSGGKKKSFVKRDYLFRRKKYCKFCDSGIAFIDYKDIKLITPSVAATSR